MLQCPATGEELTVDDLLELRSDKAVKPRPVEAASIPGLLAIMQVSVKGVIGGAEGGVLISYMVIVLRTVDHRIPTMPEWKNVGL